MHGQNVSFEGVQIKNINLKYISKTIHYNSLKLINFDISSLIGR